MKKSLLAFILPLAIVSLSSCSLYNGKNKDGSPKDGSSSSSVAPTTQTSTSGEEPTTSSSTLPPAPTGSVNLYLVLGPNGRYEGNKMDDYASKYLENTYVGVFNIGDSLPGGEKVTSVVTGSSFSHWVNRDTTETVSVVPAEDSVLVAVFVDGDGANRPEPSKDIPEEGFGFLFQAPAGGKPRYALGVDEGVDYQQRPQKHVPNMSFYKDEKFQLYDFKRAAGWTVPLEAACLDGHVDEYLLRNGDWYEVLKDFNAKDIYIKLSYGNDELYMGLA